MLLLFILAPPRQHEGTDRPGGCGTPKLAWESREGNAGEAGLGHVMLQMAPMPSFKALDSNLLTSHPEIVWKCRLRMEAQTFTEGRGFRRF